MDFKVYYNDDADINLIKQKKVAVLGFGSQGHAHALNLKNSEVDVVVGLPLNSKSREKAESTGLKVLTPDAAARWADVVMLLVPDEVMADVYEKQVAPHLQTGNFLAFAHGFNIHFKKIIPPEGVGVFMVAPKGPGHMVRRQFTEGNGVPCLVACLEEENYDLFKLGLSYAKAIGGTRAGVFKTNFKEETETDLFGEQAVLCGGLTGLIKAGFDTLTNKGYSPVMAYFECVHEIKLIVDLIYEQGLSGMRHSISNTAEYGDYLAGPKLIDETVKSKMEELLSDIQAGRFAEQWLTENKTGAEKFNAIRAEETNAPIEKIGKLLREKMSFSKPNA
ncbi:MAG: ketol-acid reductoisomerase [Oligoflexales bacterium]